MSRLRSVIWMPLVAVLALAGCTGTSSEPAADGSDSPLSAYLASVWGSDLSPEEQEERFAAQQKEVEELVAQCMSDEGFEYLPNVQSATFMSSDGTEWKPDDREWVSQYGYGAVNYPGRDDQLAPEDYPEDPNQAYVSSLSESEQTAYYEALYGPGPDESEISEDGSYEYDWTAAGCQGAAQHQVQGESPFEQEEFAPILEAMNQLYTDLPSSPALADLDAQWASCMADAGHSGFVTQADAQNSIYDAINAYYEQQTEVIADDDPAYRAIGEKEIPLALADLDCREQTDYRAAYAKVQYEAEEQFISDHKAELDALKAAAEQAG